MIKVLVIGLGSIGQRHAKALLKLGVQHVAALRTGKGTKLIDGKLSGNIVMFNDESEAFGWNPTHLIISNPTGLHKHFIDKAIEKGIPFFVEKPVSGKLEEVELYKNERNIRGSVGYNLRFHGMFQFIKKCIDSRQYGNTITARLHVGQYLPDWHPYEDYRSAYYAREEYGGGAIRTLSHEIDLGQYFFGNIQSVSAKVIKVSDLKIDVDDMADIYCTTETCPHVNIHMNFLEPELIREGVVYFDQGLLKYNYLKSEVLFIGNKNKTPEVIYSEKEDYDVQYELQMKEFIFANQQVLACSFSEGIKILEVIEKCEESNRKNKMICLV